MAGRACPDPRRSHGAWVVLVVAIASGSLLGGRAPELGLLVGTVFAGGFVALSALAMGVHRKRREFTLGVGLASLCAASALASGAPPRLACFLLVASVLGAASVLMSRRHGVLHAGALVPGLVALALAAPTSALASGAKPRAALGLGLALGLFACWRSLTIAGGLRGGGAWNVADLRRRGLREALYTALWALGVSLALG